MSGSSGVQPPVPTSSFCPRSKLTVAILVLGGLVFLLLSPRSSRGAEPLVVQVGETFEVSRGISSSFEHWKLTDFDPGMMAVVHETPPDTVGAYRIGFEALKPGTTTIELRKFQKTALTTRQRQTERVPVRIQPAPDTRPGRLSPKSQAPLVSGRSDSPGQPTAPKQDGVYVNPPPNTRPEPEQPDPPSRDDGDDRAPPSGEDALPPDPVLWAQVRDLLARERFEAGRDLIRRRLQRAEDDSERLWTERLAESFRAEGQLQRAIETWYRLVKRHPGPDTARWLLNIARAHRRANRPREAELVLVRLRHRHPDHKAWFDAMRMLARLSREKGEFERSKGILEEVLRRRAPEQEPRSALLMARLLDREPPVRDYPRSVKLYTRAAAGLRGRESELAEAALQRAQHLRNSYLEYGVSN